jgi:hypothetical protein
MSDPIQDRVDAASTALKTFAKGAMGLTPDAIKASSEYQAAKREYAAAFAALRLRNSVRAK